MGMVARREFFATAAKGIEELLADELRGLGASRVKVGRAGVAFGGTLETAYRACLWSRVGNRVLLPLASFHAADAGALYAGVRSIAWEEHVSPEGSLAVDGACSQSRLDHSHFVGLKTKDAIVDRMRERFGNRPSVDTHDPEVRVNVYIHRDRATVSIDLSGSSLHRRAYRERGAAAPLKETLAAALLYIAGWPELSRRGAPLIDPMCGSGTLPIEAALMAGDTAPGLFRQRFGFHRWRGHDPALWRRLVREAEARRARGARTPPIIRGFDIDRGAVRSAVANLRRAGLSDRVTVERRALADLAPPVESAGQPGLVIANPPYGERLGRSDVLAGLYAQIGDILRRRFPGWTGYVLAGSPELAKRIGLRPKRRVVLYNGAIECRLIALPISATAVQGDRGPRWRSVD